MRYTRTSEVIAIQFKEEAFHKDPLAYPMVFDKAMTSELWANKKAEDGRYYFVNQTNTSPFSASFDVAEGDYIISESGGWYYTIPANVFESQYDKVS